MSAAIFVFGVVVFLITVYGTIVVGGLFLTGRQLDEQPELVDETTDLDTGVIERARALVRSKY